MKEKRVPLLLALAGLGLCLACGTAYLTIHGSGATMEGRVLRLNISLAQQVLKAQVALQNYFTTAEAEFLSEHRSALDAVSFLAKELEKAGKGMAIPDSMLSSAITNLTNNLQEWKANFADPAIKYKKVFLSNPRSRKFSAFMRKGIGPRYSKNIDTALDFAKGHMEQSLTIYQARLTNHKHWLLAGATAGLVLFAGFGYVSRRHELVQLELLRRRSAQLAGEATYVERIQHLTSLDQAARMLASAVKPQATQVSVLFKTKDETGMRVAANQGGLPDGSDHSPILDDPSVCPVMQTGQRFMIQNVASEPACDCPLGAPRSGGYSCMPLTVQGRLLGLMNWQSGPGRLQTQSELDHAEALVRVTSIQLSQLFTLDTAKHEATIDQLTGIFNRRFLDGFLAKQISASLRQSHPLAVLMLDLDQFKPFNDRHGHQAGDAVLKSFARILTNSVREGDVVARYGGEEFTVVLPNTARQPTHVIAERIRAGVETMRVPELAGIASPVITVSIGLAMAPEDGQESASLINAADAALYRAKQAGRNRIVLASQPLPQIRRNL